MEETRCDEDREIKLGCPQVGKGARFTVAFESIIAHKDWFDCTAVAGEDLAAWEHSQGSLHHCASWGPMAPKVHLPLLDTKWLFQGLVPFHIPGANDPVALLHQSKGHRIKGLQSGCNGELMETSGLLCLLLALVLKTCKWKHKTTANYWEFVALTSNYFRHHGSR